MTADSTLPTYALFGSAAPVTMTVSATGICLLFLTTFPR
jgi:hypothetical protein